MSRSYLILLVWLVLFGCSKAFGLLAPKSAWKLGNVKRYSLCEHGVPKIRSFHTSVVTRQFNFQLHATNTIISPFDTSRKDETVNRSSQENQLANDDDDELPLTRENVERVLDEMRPYLKADGGNVKLAEIDGPVVKLELVGACGTCPSSAMTMKMGLERKLKERIPEIAEVIQSLPNAPELNNNNVETVLDGVRPFLKVAGGKISLESLSGVGSMQPSVKLKMEGTAASLQSVKSEIMQRIQRHFMMAVRVEWI